tara:strand:- start:8 stop:1090 length:1083 start_codon:yes stop_codon:yes gene_type:complete
MVKKIIVSKIMSDSEIAEREGEHFDESYYNIIVDEDADVYTESGKLLLKLRKNVIPKKLTDAALESYRSAAKVKRDNRGASAGSLDRNKLPSYVGDFVNKKKFRTGFVSSHSGKTSKQMVGNLAPSNIIGYYDKIDRNLLKKNGSPCRLTAYNRDNPELWKKSLGFLKAADRQFKKLTPELHKKQLKQCQEVKEFAIEDTAFSTVTINYSWRTALHKDAGDYIDGFGNLMVIEDSENPNKYEGAYTGFPQYGVAANVRTGDFLAMDVHEWHANTEFKPVHSAGGNFKERDINNKWHFNRLSVVCYLREKMIRCKNLDMKKYNNKSYDLQTGGGDNIKEKIYKNLPSEWIKLMNLKYGLFI